MTGWDVGRWVAVDLPDGIRRYDWLPDEQPTSPDGTSGRWHIVGDSGVHGRWEWHADAAASTAPVQLPPVPQPPAYEPSGGGQPQGIPPTPDPGTKTKPKKPKDPKSPKAPRPARDLKRPKNAKATGEKRPGEISNRTAIISIVAAAVVLGAAVLVFTLGDNGDSAVGAALTLTQPTPLPGGPSLAETPSASAVPGSVISAAEADLNFPKVSGDWTLYQITLEKGADGNFSGSGIISYVGTARGATGSFALTIYSGGQAVGTMTAATSGANPNTRTTVSWTSTDPWVQQQDGMAFTAS